MPVKSLHFQFSKIWLSVYGMYEINSLLKSLSGKTIVNSPLDRPSFQGTFLKNQGQARHLDRVPVADENLLFVNVEIDGRNDGEIGGRPLVEVDDELEGDVGELLADSGEHEGAVGWEAEEGAVEGAEDAAAGRQAVGGLGAEAAAHPAAQRALLVGLAVARVALDQVAPETAAPPRAVAVPEELLGLEERRPCMKLWWWSRLGTPKPRPPGPLLGWAGLSVMGLQFATSQAGSSQTVPAFLVTQMPNNMLPRLYWFQSRIWGSSRWVVELITANQPEWEAGQGTR